MWCGQQISSPTLKKSSNNKDRMITLPFYFDFPVIIMKDGRFEGHVWYNNNYRKEDSELSKQWIRKVVSKVSTFFRIAFHDKKSLLTSRFWEEKRVSNLKEETSQKTKALNLTLSEQVMDVFTFKLKNCIVSFHKKVSTGELEQQYEIFISYFLHRQWLYF